MKGHLIKKKVPVKRANSVHYEFRNVNPDKDDTPVAKMKINAEEFLKEHKGSPIYDNMRMGDPVVSYITNIARTKDSDGRYKVFLTTADGGSHYAWFRANQIDYFIEKGKALAEKTGAKPPKKLAVEGARASELMIAPIDAPVSRIQQEKNKPGNAKLITKLLGKKPPVTDSVIDENTLNTNTYESLKKEDPNRSLEYLKKHGVTWKESPVAKVNSMRAKMAMNKKVNGGTVEKVKPPKPEKSVKSPKVSKTAGLSGYDDFISSFGGDNGKLLESLKTKGVTWKEHESSTAINVMRAKMALQSHIKSGKSIENTKKTKPKKKS